MRATGDRALSFAQRYFDPDVVFSRLEDAAFEWLTAVVPSSE